MKQLNRSEYEKAEAIRSAIDTILCHVPLAAFVMASVWAWVR